MAAVFATRRPAKSQHIASAIIAQLRYKLGIAKWEIKSYGETHNRYKQKFDDAQELVNESGSKCNEQLEEERSEEYLEIASSLRSSQ